MQQINSVITTFQKARFSKTGTQAGGRGLETQLNSEIATWLARQVPADMDKAAVSRAQSHGVRLGVRYQGRYPIGPNGERLPSYTVAVGCDIHGDAENRERALADLRNFMEPAPFCEIERWLAELAVLTASRNKTYFEAELTVTAYAARLAQYPADVARNVILKQAWQWWPTWGEMERICEAQASPRRHMIAALQQPVPDPEPSRPASTQEERDRIAALIAEKFPGVSQQWKEAAVAHIAPKRMGGGE